MTPSTPSGIDQSSRAAGCGVSGHPGVDDRDIVTAFAQCCFKTGWKPLLSLKVVGRHQTVAEADERDFLGSRSLHGRSGDPEREAQCGDQSLKTHGVNL